MMNTVSAEAFAVAKDALLEGRKEAWELFLNAGARFFPLNPKATLVADIVDRDSKRGGVVRKGEVAKGAMAEVVKGKSIRLFGIKERWDHEQRKNVWVSYDRTFQVGDAAEYDSYNLSYVGVIISITEKTVTIASRHDSTRKYRLNLHTFNWRNWDFDAEETHKRNVEIGMYL